MLFEGIDLNLERIPKHVAMIMDGNRRWAKQECVSILSGHREGMQKVIEIMEVCRDVGVEVLSLFAFSKENWKRGEVEVENLLYLFKYFFYREFKKLKSRNVRIIHSGMRDGFGEDIKKIIDEMEEGTRGNEDFILNLAINYSGRLEILEGMKRLSRDILKEEMGIEDINERNFKRYLFHPDLPDPDFLIRTSGEERISNFLLWQLAYTELYFTPVLWPSFSRKDFILALKDYEERDRRFGGLS